ncbi:MAG: 50S ribosomal protein L31e [Euryarchaeota archaeon]|nr:50S ribosomal protein L31e [Euryarchaeota archaeon]
MAEEEKKERLLTVPLRFAHNQPRSRRADLAMSAIREFVGKQMKVDKEKVWMAPEVNEAVWARGKQKPPLKLKVKVEKWADGAVEVTIPEE